MENGQETERLHLCSTRSGSTAGAGCDLPTRSLSLADSYFLVFFFHSSRHSRVGSSSGSGVSCGGRCASGTWRRFTRIRVHVDDRPRIESTSTSSAARCSDAPACFFFQRSKPARAASRSGELATVISGIFARGLLEAERAREGATRGSSPSILRKCGGQGASPS